MHNRNLVVLDGFVQSIVVPAAIGMICMQPFHHAVMAITAGRIECNVSASHFEVIMQPLKHFDVPIFCSTIHGCSRASLSPIFVQPLNNRKMAVCRSQIHCVMWKWFLPLLLILWNVSIHSMNVFHNIKMAQFACQITICPFFVWFPILEWNDMTKQIVICQHFVCGVHFNGWGEWRATKKLFYFFPFFRNMKRKKGKECRTDDRPRRILLSSRSLSFIFIFSEKEKEKKRHFPKNAKQRYRPWRATRG